MSAPSVRRSLKVALAWAIGMRIFLTGYMALLALVLPQPATFAGPDPSVEIYSTGWERLLFGVWQREDAIWYQKIATAGYSTQDMTQEFFPLYPMLLRWVYLATGLNPVASGLVVSGVALVGALASLHLLLSSEFGSAVASRAVMYVSIFPTAFFFHSVYTESLALFVIALSFLLASRGRLLAALPVAFLVGLVKVQGVLVGIPLALAYLEWARASSDGWGDTVRRLRNLVPAALLLAAPVLGFLVFLLRVETAWRAPWVSTGIGPEQRIPGLPGIALLNEMKLFASGVVHPIELLNFLLAILFITLSLCSFRGMRPSYGVLAMLLLLVPLSRTIPDFPLMSFSRYVLLFVPCFVVLARWGQRGWIHRTITWAFFAGLLFWSGQSYLGGFVG